MSESNRSSLWMVAESEIGETPTTPTLVEIPRASSNLQVTHERVTSATIRADRQTYARPLVGVSASGDVSMELTAETPSEIYAAALAGAFVENSKAGSALEGSAALDASAQTITFTDADDYALFNGANIIKISGSTGEGAMSNNGTFEIVNRGSGTSYVLTLAAGSIKSAENTTSNTALTLSVKYVRNGTERPSFTLEEAFEDKSVFRSYRGVRFNTLSMELASKSRVTGSFGVIGLGGDVAETSIASAKTPATVASVRDIITTTSGIGVMRIDGLEADRCFTQMNFAINQNIEERPCIGQLESSDHRYGSFEATGEFSAYLGDSDLMAAYLDDEEASIRLILKDEVGSRIAIDMPRVVLDTSTAAVTGKNADVVEDVAFTTLADSIRGYHMQIDIL